MGHASQDYSEEIHDNPLKFIATISKFHFLINLYQKIIKNVIKTAVSLNIPDARKWYWNIRIYDIDQKCGTEKDDYDL